MVMDMGQDVEADTVELAFQPTARDFASALRARRKISRSARILLGAEVLVLAAAALQVAAGLARGRVDVFWLVLACYFGLLPVVAARLQARRLARIAGLSGPCRATVTDAGLTVRTEHTTVTQSWGARPVHRETPEVFALFSGDRNASCLTLLPKRALRDAADADRLREIIDRNLTRG